MRFPALVGLTAAVALFAAAAADARTVMLNWTEKSSPSYGFPSMTFRVKSVTVVGNTWSVRASVANRSKVDVKVTTAGDGGGGPWAQYRFGLILPPGACHKVQYMCGSGGAGEVQATSYRPSVPSVLKPGQVWSGTFSGHGAIPRGVLIDVALGYFSAPVLKKDFAWTTQHEFRL